MEREVSHEMEGWERGRGESDEKINQLKHTDTSMFVRLCVFACVCINE